MTISPKIITIISVAVVIFAVGLILIWQVPDDPANLSTPTESPTPSPIVQAIEGVVWLSAPRKINPLDPPILFRDAGSGKTPPIDYYQLGNDQGDTIIMAVHDTQTIEGVYNFFFVQRNSQYRFLEQHWWDSVGDTGFDFSSQVVRDSSSYYPALKAPDNFVFMGQQFYGGGIGLPENKPMIFVGTVASGELYSTATPYEVGLSLQEYVLKLPSGLTSDYSATHFAFLTDNRVPQIAWNDGTNNQYVYDYSGSAGGCGTGKVAIFINPNLNQFAQTGTTNTGEPIYEYKNQDNPVVRRFYDATVTTITFEEYATKHPVFIYHDTLDRWVVFNNLTYGGGAECGKPVIYLYPEQPTQVSVKVGARITVSEPEYGNGWNVLAEPTGKQTLFWEGLGNGPYPEITQGFVVKQADLEATIRRHLAQLGLNDRESQDFLDFWLPHLPTTPYTRLTWLGTWQMDALAPLAIKPKPDAVIRVFLDFEGLEEPIAIPSQRLSAIPRKDFTVVEWGGLLRR